MSIFFRLVPFVVSGMVASAAWIAMGAVPALNAVPTSKSLVQPFPTQPLMNEVVVFEPVAGHHLNIAAPNSCGAQKQIGISAKGLNCQFNSAVDSQITLNVCDDAKTYCRQEVVTVGPEGSKGLVGWVKRQVQRVIPEKAYPGYTDKTPNTAARGFIHNDLALAKKLARESGKPMLIYFTQLYCPPCAMLKEYSLDTDRFAELTKDVVKVQIDADTDKTVALITDIEGVKTTPTLILFNSRLERVGVSRELLSADTLAEWITETLKNPSTGPIEKVEERLARNKVSDIVNGLPTTQPCLTNRLFWPVTQSKLSKSDLSKAVSLAQRQIESAMKFTSKLECVIEVAYLNEVIARFYEKAGNLKRRDEYNRQSHAAYLRLNEIPGARPDKALKFYLAMLSDNDSSKYQELAEEHPGDFSFEYLQAMGAYYDKKYDLALTAAEKSLAKATGRNWLKVINLKAEILVELGRAPEAQALINHTLSKTKLPSDAGARIHEWVQGIRKLEAKMRSKAQKAI